MFFNIPLINLVHLIQTKMNTSMKWKTIGFCEVWPIVNEYEMPRQRLALEDCF